jgi:hypothetical protein
MHALKRAGPGGMRASRPSAAAPRGAPRQAVAARTAAALRTAAPAPRVHTRRVAARASPFDQLRDMLAGRKVLAVEQEEEGLGEMARLDGATPGGAAVGRGGRPRRAAPRGAARAQGLRPRQLLSPSHAHAHPHPHAHPLAAGTEEVFGPTAVLLVGFMENEVSRVRSVLDEMGADMVAVVPAGRALMGKTLREALEGGGPALYEKVRGPAGAAGWRGPSTARAAAAKPAAAAPPSTVRRAPRAPRAPRCAPRAAPTARSPTALPPAPPCRRAAAAGPAPRTTDEWHVHVRGAGGHRWLQVRAGGGGGGDREGGGARGERLRQGGGRASAVPARAPHRASPTRPPAAPPAGTPVCRRPYLPRPCPTTTTAPSPTSWSRAGRIRWPRSSAPSSARWARAWRRPEPPPPAARRAPAGVPTGDTGPRPTATTLAGPGQAVGRCNSQNTHAWPVPACPSAHS